MVNSGSILTRNFRVEKNFAPLYTVDSRLSKRGIISCYRGCQKYVPFGNANKVPVSVDLVQVNRTGFAKAMTRMAVVPFRGRPYS